MKFRYRTILWLVPLFCFVVLTYLTTFYENWFTVIAYCWNILNVFTGLNIGLMWLDRHPYDSTPTWKEAREHLDICKKLVEDHKEKSKTLINGVNTVTQMEKAFGNLCEEVKRIKEDPRCSYDCDLMRENLVEAIQDFVQKVHEIEEFNP